ncbi:hypothetical protein ACHAXH_002618, partial [Discostella pseudostelligera]
MAPLLSRTISFGLLLAKSSAFHSSKTALPSASSSLLSRAIVTTASSSPFLVAASPTSPTSSTPARPPMARRMIGSILDLLSGGDGGMIKPDQALKGRSEKMAGISGLKHYILNTDLEEVPPGYEVAIFGNGCFWGSEKSIWRMPKGIHSTAVGYCAGYTPNPTYNEACSSMTGHTEGVRVVYNPAEISFVDIMRMFWESHDPTQYMGQGNDRGSQYRSGFYYFNEDQKRLLESSKAAYEKALGGRTIQTEIAAASDYDKHGGVWYFAEPYHQQYLAKPGARPYCSAQPQGVSLPPFETWAPEDLKEKYMPKLPESFWKKHG